MRRGWIYNPYTPFEPITIHCDHEPESFDVAARQDEDEYWYGWCNEVWTHGLQREEWKLEKGEYLVEVTITSGDVQVASSFCFNTDTGKIAAWSCCRAFG